MGSFNTPYDDTFRTMLADCKRLVIPLVNEMFHQSYADDENVELYQNELFIQEGDEKKRITDSNFSIGKQSKRYNIECQSTPDGTIIVRAFEYASQIAVITADSGVAETTFMLPNTGILYLRYKSDTKKEHTVNVVVPNGETVSYTIPIIRIRDYSIEEIFAKKLWFLIPFYFFNYSLNKLENNQELIEQMIGQYKEIWEKLDRLVEEGVLKEAEKGIIKEMCRIVAEALSGNHEKVREGVETIMGGQILEYGYKTAYNEGKTEGSLLKLISQVCSKIKKGKTIPEIAEALEEDESVIGKICEIAGTVVPRFDADAILEELKKTT